VNTPRPLESDVPQPINFFQTWSEVPDSAKLRQRLKTEWEMFIRHLYRGAIQMTLVEGAKGVQLAEAGTAELEGTALDRHPGVKVVTLMPTLNLPVSGGKLAPYTTKPPRAFPAREAAVQPHRLCGGHVVADPFAEGDPWLDAAIDWERTIAFRRHLWSSSRRRGSDDTAQRGIGHGLAAIARV